MLADEPTNHLDMGAIEALANALKGFSGGVLVISHDQVLSITSYRKSSEITDIFSFCVCFVAEINVAIALLIFLHYLMLPIFGHSKRVLPPCPLCDHPGVTVILSIFLSIVIDVGRMLMPSPVFYHLIVYILFGLLISSFPPLLSTHNFLFIFVTSQLLTLTILHTSSIS